jgi:hypothetical protein
MSRVSLEEFAKYKGRPLSGCDGAIKQDVDGQLRDESETAPVIQFRPTPFAWKDPVNIKPREWLYAHHYIRGFVTCTIGRRGQGKTTRTIVEFLSMATGRDLLKTGKMPSNKLRVWYLGEDPRDEIERRIIAACAHYGITPDEIGDRLYFDSVLDLPRGAAKIARVQNGAVVPNESAIATLKQGILDRRIDVLILDPLKKFHGARENDNDVMDDVMAILSEIAAEMRVSIEILHHTRKPISGASDVPMTVDDARGADAIIAAVRSARVITVMTAKDAPMLGIEAKDAWRYNRIDDGKANMKPPGEAIWTQIASEVLPCGESVGVLTTWNRPDAWKDTNYEDLNAVLDDIDAGLPNGQRYSDAARADKRAVWRVVKNHFPDKTDAQCRSMIHTWVRNGVLYQENYVDPIDRKERVGLRVDAAKRPSTTATYS